MKQAPELPPEIREASHKLADATTQLQATAREVIRKGDAFSALARVMQRGRDNG